MPMPDSSIDKKKRTKVFKKTAVAPAAPHIGRKIQKKRLAHLAGESAR
jgi:hypothetical protein